MAKKNTSTTKTVITPATKSAEPLVILHTSPAGWTKELNIIKWNDDTPVKFDIRDWSPEHDKFGKGICLTRKEAKDLAIAINKALRDKTLAVE